MELLSQEVVLPENVISKIKINVEMTVITGYLKKWNTLSGPPLRLLSGPYISSCVGNVTFSVLLLTSLGSSLYQEEHLVFRTYAR